jgi:glutamine phosphoribosylpyrophosphate amidotransferase
MCGIVGAVINQVSEKSMKLLSQLMIQSRIRGMHSFGYAVIADGMTDIQFRISKLDDIIDHIDSWAFTAGESRCIKFIGHCRYSTSGLSPQPIMVSDYPNVALAFNGNINMGIKSKLELIYRMDLETDNDGEVFLRKMMLGEDAVNFISDPLISFAGLWLKDDQVFMLRNERRPGYVARVDGNVFAVSTKDIAKRAGIPAGCLDELPPNEIFNLGVL